MAGFLNFNYISIFCILIFCCSTLTARPTSSSPTRSLSTNPNFDPETDILGDAQIADDGSSVSLTRPSTSSSGLLLRKSPIRLADATSGNPTSFSTEFSFSISPDDGDGLVLVLFPGNVSSIFPGKGTFGLSLENNFLGVEFDTSLDDNVGDLNANHVGINVANLVSSVVGNVSSINLVLNSGEKLKSWVDYNASSKRLEVRLSRLNEPRPFSPIIAHAIDLLKLWGNKDVFVGISSANGNSQQITSVYSWKLSLRVFPKWMHSLPVDPRGYSEQKHDENFRSHKRNYCPLSILAGLIFVTGSFALVAFLLLFMWAIFISKYEECPVKIPAHPADFRYERIDVAIEKNTTDEKLEHKCFS
ncbi:hypothetical protein L6164_032930 [Bauhinia variegata]|uniref:Uncharacterized protein n=1 Tax=Bauhinia variegata TaxID=167791 RepID=A0ACB9KQ70_BAUVA|nr:hypothetical protein L6164_032930 [Bauhinia variegata]